MMDGGMIILLPAKFVIINVRPVLIRLISARLVLTLLEIYLKIVLVKTGHMMLVYLNANLVTINVRLV
jgi:hypothetical protein